MGTYINNNNNMPIRYYNNNVKYGRRKINKNNIILYISKRYFRINLWVMKILTILKSLLPCILPLMIYIVYYRALLLNYFNIVISVCYSSYGNIHFVLLSLDEVLIIYIIGTTSSLYARFFEMFFS